MKVLIVGEYGSSTYYRPFRKFGEQTHNSDLLWLNPKEIRLVVFTGGADVTPALYGEKSAKGTDCVPRRDIYESVTFHRAKMLGKRMVGICRGAQFLCVMAGGKLCQHLDGHTQYHDMDTCDGETFLVSSTHHQMALPPTHAKVIGWSSQKRSYRYWGEQDKAINPVPEKEYEVIHYPNISAVGIQYHPEIMTEKERGFHYAAQLVERYLL